MISSLGTIKPCFTVVHTLHKIREFYMTPSIPSPPTWGHTHQNLMVTTSITKLPSEKKKHAVLLIKKTDKRCSHLPCSGS